MVGRPYKLDSQTTLCHIIRCWKSCASLVCRKKRILSTPDRTCHLAPRSMKFLAIRLSLAVSSLPPSPDSVVYFWFRGNIAIYHNNIRRTKSPVLRMIQPSSINKNAFELRTPYQRPERTPSRSNAHRPPRNGQPRRRLEHPSGSNIRVCLNFVSIRFLWQKLLYVAYVWIAVVGLKFISSVGQKIQRRGGGGNMVFIVVEAVPASSKPTAGVDASPRVRDTALALRRLHRPEHHPCI